MSSALAYHLSDAGLYARLSPALAAVSSGCGAEDMVLQEGSKLVARRIAVVGFDGVADVGLVLQAGAGWWRRCRAGPPMRSQ